MIGTYVLLFLGGFVLCGIGVVFFPLLVRIEFGAGKELTPPLWMELRLWGLRVLRVPGKRSARSFVVGRWLLRWFDKVLSRQQESPSPPAPSKSPRKTSSPWKFGFLRWAAFRLGVLGARLTRRLQIRCAGINPAMLGALSGVAGIVGGMLGTRRLVWIPDFTPSAARVEVRWELSISIWKLVRWTGETFVDRNRHA